MIRVYAVRDYVHVVSAKILSKLHSRMPGNCGQDNARIGIDAPLQAAKQEIVELPVQVAKTKTTKAV